MNVDPASKQGNVDMRGHGKTCGVFHGAGFYGLDDPRSVFGGGSTAKTVEGLFQIVCAVVDALRIRLPELQKRVTNQMAVAVIHVAHQYDVLTCRARLGHFIPDFLFSRRITSRLQRQADMHIRAGSLRRGFR
ncbi:hypothetical protein D9M68_898360 [compost metagenome]